MERRKKLWGKAPSGPLTTAIGSLPHAYVDAALKFSFKMRIPFLPQIPMRNPNEFMVTQAIDLLPGVHSEDGAHIFLTDKVWGKNTHALREKTEKAFENSKQESAFEAFEPSPDVWNCWNPFIFELHERKVSFAKIELAGPMTCQWALRLDDGSPADKNPDVGMQVFRLALARAIAMSRKVKEEGVVPLFYLDEPGFYAFSSKNVRHVMALQELKLFVQTLQKEDVLVGIHICSNTEWDSVLSLPIDVLSFDTNLSLNLLLTHKEALRGFLGNGGRLSMGIVPTGVHSLKVQSFTPKLLLEHFLHTLHEDLKGEEALISQIMQTSLITPACGLALHNVEDADTILSHTLEIGRLWADYQS